MGNIFLIFIILLSRVFFLSPLPIYFDSPEYTRLIENPNLLQALTLGHEPIHPGYILPAWILDRIFPFLGALYSAEIVSSIFGALGLFVFYKIVKLLFSKSIALKSLLIASLLPVFFLSSTNVLTDTTYIFFYLLSFHCLLNSKNTFNKWYLLGILSLGYAVFTHTQVILWFPVFLTPVFLEKKEKIEILKKVLLFLSLGLIFGVGSLVTLLVFAGSTIVQGIQLLFMHGGDIYGTGDILHDFLRSVRNFGIILLRNNATIVVLASMLGSIFLLKKNRYLFLVLVLWFLPTLLVTQYWHIGLFGRIALIASFPLAVLVSFTPRIIYLFVVLQLLIVFIPLACINRNAPIQSKLIDIYKSIPKDSVLISSNLIRPQVSFVGETYFINEPGQSLEYIDGKIKTALKYGKRVYIDSQALYNPYYSYDGNHLHVLSLGKIGNSKIQPLFEKYSLRVIKTTDNKRIFLYIIDPVSVFHSESFYTYEYLDGFQNKLHKERIDYLDFGMWTWAILSNKKEPNVWKL